MWERGSSGDRGSYTSSLKLRPCKQSWLLHTDLIRRPVSTVTFPISCFYVALVDSDLLCLWKLRNPTGEGSLSTVAVCQVQLVLIHSAGKLHYQLERGVSSAGGGRGRRSARCCDQRSPQGTLHLCPALLSAPGLGGGPCTAHKSSSISALCSASVLCAGRAL